MTVETEKVVQRRLDGTTAHVPVRNVFSLPFGEIRAALEASTVKCFMCDKTGLICDSPAGLLGVEVYDSPWQEEPTLVYTHRYDRQKEYGYSGYRQSCLDALFDSQLGDFHYEHCKGCDRDIIVRCPSNGWHGYFRLQNDCELICLRCYEEEIYENGLPRESFEDGQIPGMFFDTADLEAHGFAPVADWRDRFIKGGQDARAFCDKALTLIDGGQKVAVDYGAQAIGGSEGYASLFAR